MRIFRPGSSRTWPIFFLTQFTSIRLDLVARLMNLSENMRIPMDSFF